MDSRGPFSLWAGSVVVLLAAVALANCGRVEDNSATAASVAVKPENGTSETVRVARRGPGSILVDPRGRTLYLFEKDRGGKSTCLGPCAKDWPPLRVSGKPIAGSGGAYVSMLGTTPRADGMAQVTYRGHPLYLFRGDRRAGDTYGHGLFYFDALWHAVSPMGNAVKADR
jgi:predicted lipoprotein with Yx(FWY)xxD motif